MKDTIIGRTITAHELKARWAYSELRSPRFGENYTGLGPLRLYQMSAKGVPFSELGKADHDPLVEMLNHGRSPSMVAAIGNRADTYRCEAWTKGQLSHTWVLPIYNPAANGICIRYYDFYLGSPIIGPSGEIDETDARVAAQAIPLNYSVDTAHEPGIVVRVGASSLMLLDGYLRSILFMRSSDSGHRFRVWVPNIE